jgi:hypothetical protein
MANSDVSAETTRPPSTEGRPSQSQFSVPSEATAQSGIAGTPRHLPVPLEMLANTGEPVDVPPPLIEPIFIGFDEAPPADPSPEDFPRAEPAPRRGLLAQFGGIRLGRFLRVVRGIWPPAAVASRQPVGEPAVLVAAEPTVEPEPKRLSFQAPARMLARAQQWGGATLPKLGGRRWFYWGRWAGAAAILVAVVVFAGFGPFHRPAPGSIAPLANAPSDPAQRLGYFQRGSDAGDAEAELQLAILYAKGEGVTQDYTIAARWFRAAAEQGLARAQYDLGVLYERGRGVTTDPKQAARWYLKAAEGKYPLAQYNLAVAYTKGEGTRKDTTEAVLWYRRAAAQGVVQAMVNLGMLYERGEGVSASQVDAYAWYLAAGRRGNQPAARRAEDLFGVLSQHDQIRAQVLAGNIAGAIHDPVQGTPGG